MSDIIRTTPILPKDDKLVELYVEQIAKQGEQMDLLSRQLITLELAIPGVFATALKVTLGDKVAVGLSWPLAVAFGCWALALLCTLIGMVPRKYLVNEDVLFRQPDASGGERGIKDFFFLSARYKRRFVIGSCLLFFLGIVFAVLSLF